MTEKSLSAAVETLGEVAKESRHVVQVLVNAAASKEEEEALG